MKKSILAALAVVSFSAMATAAGTVVPANSMSGNVSVLEEKVKIKPEELPEAVKKALTADEYKGWTVANAYMYKESLAYEVEVKKGEEMKTFKFDKEGKLLK